MPWLDALQRVHKLLTLVFFPWVEVTVASRRDKVAAFEAEREDREKAAKKMELVSTLNEIGALWFAEMEEKAELSDFGNAKGLILAIHRDVGEEMAEAERSEEKKTRKLLGDLEAARAIDAGAVGTGEADSPKRLRRRASWVEGWNRRGSMSSHRSVDDHINRLRDRLHHRTVLDLLDSRYMAPGGQLHGRHIEAEYKLLRETVAEQIAALNEQYTFLRSMFSEVIKASGSPVVAALEGDFRGKPIGDRKLRPMKQVRYSDLGFNMSDGGGIRDDPVTLSPPLGHKTLKSSKSAAAMLPEHGGAGSIVLNPVRSPRGRNL